MKDIRVVDTTLRDGEQSAGIALGLHEKIEIAKIIDKMGVYQIEAGIPIMGGIEKKSIIKIAEAGLRSRVSVWNRININDVKDSLDCGNVIIHVSVPSSDIQIQHKLGRSRGWVLDNLSRCIYTVKESGREITVGLEDASRADLSFLKMVCERCMKEGVSRVRYADTVGILYAEKTYQDIKGLIESTNVDIEMHAHDDLGMAVANSVAAVSAGAVYVDTTIAGIGERAGNCNFLKFITAAKERFKTFADYDLDKLEYMEREIIKRMKSKHISLVKGL
ncbi:MAG TPA: homocitrate synthase [Clostridia bacterium]